jgi:hypothetical protein
LLSTQGDELAFKEPDHTTDGAMPQEQALIGIQAVVTRCGMAMMKCPRRNNKEADVPPEAYQHTVAMPLAIAALPHAS